jgi:pyridoxamine 5'-phosphate oxidase
MKEILEKIRHGRHEFENAQLEGIGGGEPFSLFEKWMAEAIEKKEKEPNAFALSTVDNESQATSRIVYLKDLLEAQFVFYTNYRSKKASDIEHNSKISMLFFWPAISRQIRIKGICTKLDAALSDAYFDSRSRSSQIGAWASNQSEELEDRNELEIRVREFESKFSGSVPRPQHWGGYQIRPTSFEFWQGRSSRLHDRLVFELRGNNWESHKKNP